MRPADGSGEEKKVESKLIPVFPTLGKLREGMRDEVSQGLYEMEIRRQMDFRGTPNIRGEVQWELAKETGLQIWKHGCQY